MDLGPTANSLRSGSLSAGTRGLSPSSHPSSVLPLPCVFHQLSPCDPVPTSGLGLLVLSLFFNEIKTFSKCSIFDIEGGGAPLGSLWVSGIPSVRTVWDIQEKEVDRVRADALWTILVPLA